MNASTGPMLVRNISAMRSRSDILPPIASPALLLRQPAPRRSKIWEFSTNLHCSIIGTCLSTAELRKILARSGLAAPDSTDHDLHGVAVTLAGRHDEAARQLHKALDQRHRVAINQFGKAARSDALRVMKRGDIPGAYWATLTHPRTDQAIIREAFGDVHMLSHLIGSANRADIRRLCTLEAEKAALQEKLHRQQQALQDAVLRRDGQIVVLRQALANQAAAECAAAPAAGEPALHDLIAGHERRLAAETRRRVALEERHAAVLRERDTERSSRERAEREAGELRQELTAIEATLILPTKSAPAEPASAARLDGATLLYVGGRPSQVTHIRAMIETLGGTLLHHDGGMENHQNLLSGLASRCDLVLFPVDCISHDAAKTVKTLCRKAGKRYIPLRSASITSVLAVLPAARPEAAA